MIQQLPNHLCKAMVLCAFLVGLDLEPVIVLLLVHFDVLDEGHVLLLQPIVPVRVSV